MIKFVKNQVEANLENWSCYIIHYKPSLINIQQYLTHYCTVFFQEFQVAALNPINTGNCKNYNKWLALLYKMPMSVWSN